MYQLYDTHRAKHDLPPADNTFHFCRAAELAWTRYLIEGIDEELEREGALTFRLEGNDFVRVGEGFIELTIKGNQARCDREDINAVSVKKGVFTITRNDAKIGWFRKDGVFELQYGTMGNAKLFVISLEKLLGVELS